MWPVVCFSESAVVTGVICMSDWSVVWWSVQSRDDDLLSLLPTNTDNPTGQPTGQPTVHPTMAPSSSSSPAPSPVPSSVTAIQNEGLACMAMAASIPKLQTLTGVCKLEVVWWYWYWWCWCWWCVSCLCVVMRGYEIVDEDEWGISVRLHDMHHGPYDMWADDAMICSHSLL